MRLDFLARRGGVPEYFRDHAEPRLESLDHYHQGITQARVALAEQRGRFTVEITVNTSKATFRSEKRTGDLLAAFDEAYAAVEKQLRRHKRRIRDHSRTSVRKLELATSETDKLASQADAEEGHADEIGIVRSKRHASKPMTPQEATIEMEMVGHDSRLPP